MACESRRRRRLAARFSKLLFIRGKSIVPSYRIVVKDGIRFAVTALASPERLFPRDDSCVVLPPFSSVRKIWKEMVRASDFRIILSHLGEEMTTMLADSFPDCDILVNGHRRISQSPVTMKGKTLVMQFGYEGKKLSFARTIFSKGHHSAGVEKSGWLSVGPSGAADSAVGTVLAAKGGAEARGVYDLYIMGQCPYGRAALREFIEFVKKFAGIEWNVWFIGTVTDDSPSSLHGGEEAKDEMSWLAVKALYPGRWLDFLAARSGEGATTVSVISKMRLDSASIAAWARVSGRQAVADHYRRSMRLNIQASPTLLINNTLFEKAVERRRLVKTQCLMIREGMTKPSFCDSVPECFDDKECRKKGAIGRCLPAGTCGYTPDVQFSFIALVADSTVQHPEKSVIATTEELFPNASLETVTLASAKGRMMMKTYAPLSLPFYLFGNGIAKAYNYLRVESGLIGVANGFTFKDGITPKNYFPQRERTAHTLVLFVDPLFSGAVQVIGAVCADTLLAKKVRIAPVLYADPETAAPAVDEKIRREEALRWLVMDSLHHDNYVKYLARFIQDPGSSYWFINLSASGIAQDIFIRHIHEQAARLSDHWRLLTALGIKNPMTLLMENRQIAVIQNEAELTAAVNAGM